MRTLLSALTLTCILSTSALAGQIFLPTPLSALVGTDDFVMVDGLTFDSFTYTTTGDMPPATTVNLLEHFGIDGNPGLRFQGGFIDTTDPGASTAVIGFNVTAASASIAGARITGNPDLLAGTGLASATETFLPQVTSDSISVFDNGTVEQLTDTIDFPAPLQQVSVQKSISLHAEAGGAGSSISFVDQTFVVPEPTSISLFLCGFLALGGIRRRRA